MKLTILNVGQNYHITGGSDRYMFALADLLRRKGHGVVPFAARSEKNLESEWGCYFPAGADFDRPTPADLVRYIYSPQARKAVRRLLNNNHIDLAHLHIYYGKLTSSILAPLRERIPSTPPFARATFRISFRSLAHAEPPVNHVAKCTPKKGRKEEWGFFRRAREGSIFRSATQLREGPYPRAPRSILLPCILPRREGRGWPILFNARGLARPA